jgi:hypothetical protein
LPLRRKLNTAFEHKKYRTKPISSNSFYCYGLACGRFDARRAACVDAVRGIVAEGLAKLSERS